MLGILILITNKYINIIFIIYKLILSKLRYINGDWGLGPIPNPQSPIPNPQSPF